MQAGKLGLALFCGLIIGPILGSGIFILPPLVIEKAGQWAFPAWLAIILINAAFAYVFGWLSVMHPGESGVTKAVEKAFGARIKMLTSFYLIASVCIGPAAVLLTLGEYLPSVAVASYSNGPQLAGLAMIPILVCLLLQHIRNIGTVAFILSSTGALLLFVGGSLTVYGNGIPTIALPPFRLPEFGGSMLLLFWVVVGWEVIGNYSNDVDNPEKTIPRAITYSLIVITLVELAVAGGMQFGDVTGSATGVSGLLIPIFGQKASQICGLLVFGLCVTTYLMFVGAVARLLASLAEEGVIPTIFAKRIKNGSPIAAVCILCSIHAVDILLAASGIIDLAGLVSFANAFFLSNSLICVLAGLRLFQAKSRKILAAILALSLTAVLLQSTSTTLVAVILIAMWTYWPGLKTRIMRRKGVADNV